jgi:hypothetical protein
MLNSSYNPHAAEFLKSAGDRSRFPVIRQSLSGESFGPLG